MFSITDVQIDSLHRNCKRNNARFEPREWVISHPGIPRGVVDSDRPRRHRLFRRTIFPDTRRKIVIISTLVITPLPLRLPREKMHRESDSIHARARVRACAG